MSNKIFLTFLIVFILSLVSCGMIPQKTDLTITTTNNVIPEDSTTTTLNTATTTTISVPKEVSIVRVTQITNHGIAFEWDATNDALEYYVKTSEDSSLDQSGFCNFSNYWLSGSKTKFIHCNLAKNKTYYYQLFVEKRKTESSVELTPLTEVFSLTTKNEATEDQSLLPPKPQNVIIKDIKGHTFKTLIELPEGVEGFDLITNEFSTLIENGSVTTRYSNTDNKFEINTEIGYSMTNCQITVVFYNVYGRSEMYKTTIQFE